MSHNYQAVGWNRQKRIYDVTLWLGILVFLVLYIGGTAGVHPGSLNNVEILIMRGLGLCAITMLHLILSIGPLCRLDKRWLPLLYNRRHFGVSMFLVAFLHGLLALIIYHSQGNINPLVSMLAGSHEFDSISSLPFQPLGFFALIILFLMAATSHDFWLSNLTPPVWKALHMLVYVAYVLAILHVALGFLQTETGGGMTLLFALGLVWIVGIHLLVACKEKHGDLSKIGDADSDGFVLVAAVAEIPEKRGIITVLSGDRVAVFKYDGKISAISNACQHQNGPLGEGRIIDGLVTCPWHGFQYDPATGCSPPPFTERVPTFLVKVVEGKVWVHPQPNPAGTPIKPASTGEVSDG